MTSITTAADDRPVDTAPFSPDAITPPDRRSSTTFAFAPDVAGHTGFGRSILVWLAVGTVTVFAVVTASMIAGGAPHAHALGVATFAAIWGGTGFGVMLGGVIHANRIENLLRATAPVPVAVTTTSQQ